MGIFIKFTVIYCICEFAVFYCLHKSSSATVNEEDRFLECAADILIGLKHTFTFSHLADTFIQSDLQMRTMEAINKIAMIYKSYDKSQLALGSTLTRFFYI